MKHIRMVSLPNFDDIVDLKRYFLMFDCLRNLEYDLSFSLLTRYYCEARCEMCYIKDMWKHNHYEAVYNLLPSTLFDVFGYFETVSTQDDLYYLKHKHPPLFQFYKHYGSMFSSCSMSDRAFVQQWRILLEELDLRDIHDISFSEEFLAQHNWRIRDWVLPRLLYLSKKYNIRKVKVVVSEPKAQKESLKFLRDLRDAGISTDIYDNILLSRNIRHSDVMTPTNRYDCGGYSYPLFTENVYLQQSNFYLALPEATKGEHSFYGLFGVSDKPGGFDPVAFLVANLQAKKAYYARYLSELRAKGVDNKYTDYFEYVSEELHVNSDFNFIPSILLNPESSFYKRLQRQGFVDTKMGLVKKSALKSEGLELKSPVELPPAKQKLEYFKIKCERGARHAVSV